MKRILISCVVAVGLLPAPAFALGIGELTLESGLNEPFEARIALLSVTREELDTLNVRLADNEAFKRAGVDRAFLLSNLRFEIVESESGADHIRVSSREAIREPFLNFLVEVSWAKGRLYREYTVLLDPPLYDAGPAPAYTRVPAAAPATTAPAEIATDIPAGPVESAAEYATTPATASTFTGSEYGPTETSDTLWSIAGRTRPDDGVTMQQMMLALLRANPEAFISGNVNGLRRGQVLKVPGREEIEAVAPDQALAEIRSQYALWEDIRGTVAAVPQERPDVTPAAAPSAAAAPAAAPAAAENTAELRLVAATDAGSGTDQNSGGGATTSQINDRLALAKEQMATVTQENAELKSRLTESEAIITDLKRLIELKDDELAALQQQMAAGPATTPAAAEAPPAEAPVAEVPVEEESGESEPAPAAVAPETESPAEEPAPQETEGDSETPETSAPPAGPAPAEKAAAPAPAPAESAPSLVDQAIEFARGNLLIIGGALGAVVLLVAGFVAVSRFRSGMDAGAAAEPLEEFPDFAADEGAADVGPEDVTNVREANAAQSKPAAAAPAKEDATMFALPPEPKPKAAAKPAAEPAPAAASSEEVLDAFHHEVNVFMAYEDWDQAEQFVRDSLAREPNNLDFHAKLLEVFFTSGNRRKYEAAAKVLHDVVGGSGPYWDNAVVMWQEMSPNRALFAAGGEEEEAPAATAATGGGLLDLTAAASRSGDAGLDFDLGDATAEPSAKPAAAEADEPMLDITAGTDDAAPEPAAADGGDMLDVTAAVGLEPEEPSLDLEPSAAEEGVLDLTGGSEPAKKDLLDVSGAGTDLLDVTAQTDVGAQQIADEDLLDVTSTAASTRDAVEEEIAAAPAPAPADEHTLDFNLDDLPQPTAAPVEEEPAVAGGNVIEFESSGGGLSLEVPGLDEAAEEPAADGGLELDMGSGEDAADGGLELELTLDETPAEDDIDMDGTVEIPKLELELTDEDDEDDDEDHTVFVPRSGDAQEQSAEDEVATKLDLAKAYLEMGDKESKESAKGILKQILADGNDQQKRAAQELIRGIS